MLCLFRFAQAPRCNPLAGHQPLFMLTGSSARTRGKERSKLDQLATNVAGRAGRIGQTCPSTPKRASRDPTVATNPAEPRVTALVALAMLDLGGMCPPL